MDPLQMKDRCPGAEVVGIGLLRDHELRFPALVEEPELRGTVTLRIAQVSDPDALSGIFEGS
jgi:hypothetical protein